MSKYFIAPIIQDSNGLKIDIDDFGEILYSHFITDTSGHPTNAIIQTNDSVVPKSTWTVATINDWDQYTAPTLDQIKQAKLVELDTAYQASFTTFKSNALGVTKTYPINQEAQDNLKDLQQRLIADLNKNSFSFLTIEDMVLVSHTRAQFLQLLDDAETFEVTLHNKYRGYANQVTAATDAATVQAIKWT